MCSYAILMFASTSVLAWGEMEPKEILNGATAILPNSERLWFSSLHESGIGVVTDKSPLPSNVPEIVPLKLLPQSGEVISGGGTVHQGLWAVLNDSDFTYGIPDELTYKRVVDYGKISLTPYNYKIWGCSRLAL